MAATNRHIWNLVKADVETGLSGKFRNVEVVERFFDGSPSGAFTDGNGRHCVPWTCHASGDKESSKGFPDVSRTVVFEGVTILEKVGRTWTYRRIVDWSAYYAGMGRSRGRTSIPDASTRVTPTRRRRTS